jgi:hypothetical protein
MKISNLALVTMLGGALMAFGCGDDSSSSGGGGTPITADAEYGFLCTLDGLPLPLPVNIKINAADPGFIQGQPSNLTTLLNYTVAPSVIGLLPNLAPDAIVDTVSCMVSVAGGAPAEIVHSADGLPFAPEASFDSDEVTTAVTPAAEATAIGLSVTGFSATISGLPEALVPGGEIMLLAGEGGCSAVEPVEGSVPITFPVEAGTM